MKKFIFGLEKIAALRRYREREAEIVLGKAVGELSAIERNLAETAAERERIARCVPETAADILAFDRYMVRLDTAKAGFLEKAAAAEQIVETARAVYLEASRDRKVLDNMKARRYSEYRKAAAAEETNVLDDSANGAKARRRIAGAEE